MVKHKKARIGKGLFIVVALSILTVAAGIASIVLLSQNRSIAHIFGGTDNVYESARLEKMTINGYAIGDDLTDKIKRYKTVDTDFNYYYNEVAFWGDGDTIDGIGFYTFNSDNLVTDIAESNIKYENKRLLTLDDFEETFGIGEEKVEDDYRTIVYRQGDYSLTLEFYKDDLRNVILVQNQ